ncbi:MAG: hypothetical protein NTY32_03500, partial [Bacteroidia bacterium]|nr:hypothetical protein [Bacteroidia bacterium]
MTTSNITAVTSATATSGGTIISNGGAAITVSGICWSTSPTPTTTNSKTTDGLTSGTFTSTLTVLSPGVTYYVRAYATNSVGTAYGNQQTFTTTSIPSLITNNVTFVTSTTATCGGTITSNGGATITVSGVCWSTSANPTTANSKTTDGST